MRAMVDVPKWIISLLTGLCCLALAVLNALAAHWIAMLIFLAIAVVFMTIAINYGAVVTVDAQGVRWRCLGFLRRDMRWDAIREVGVVGLKVFNGKKSKRTGARYIYFSPDELDDARRFRLALQWPPRHMIYVSYDKRSLERVQMHWGRAIASYNAGEIFGLDG